MSLAVQRSVRGQRSHRALGLISIREIDIVWCEDASPGYVQPSGPVVQPWWEPLIFLVRTVGSMPKINGD